MPQGKKAPKAETTKKTQKLPYISRQKHFWPVA
jgi:hypothetical protein